MLALLRRIPLPGEAQALCATSSGSTIIAGGAQGAWRVDLGADAPAARLAPTITDITALNANPSVLLAATCSERDSPRLVAIDAASQWTDIVDELRLPADADEVNDVQLTGPLQALLATDSGQIMLVALPEPGKRMAVLRVMQRRHSNLAMRILPLPRLPFEALSAGLDGCLRRWDLRFGSMLDSGDVTEARKAHDEARAEVEADEVQDAQQARSQILNPPLLQAAAVNASGTCVVAGMGDGSLAVVPQRKRADGLVPQRYLEGGHTAGVAAVAFAAWQPETVLLSVGNDKKLVVWQGQDASGSVISRGGNNDAAAAAATTDAAVGRNSSKGGRGGGKRHGKHGKGKAAAPASSAISTESAALDGGVHGFAVVARAQLSHNVNALLSVGTWAVLADTKRGLAVYQWQEAEGGVAVEDQVEKPQGSAEASSLS